MSIIPFVKDVNLGADPTATWIYWGDSTQDPGETDNTSWEALYGTCTSNTTYNNNRSNCRTRGGTCSNNKLHAPEHLHDQRNLQSGDPHVAGHLRHQGHLQRRGQQHAKRLQLCGHVQPRWLYNPNQLPECRNLQHLRPDVAEQLPKCASLLGG